MQLLFPSTTVRYRFSSLYLAISGSLLLSPGAPAAVLGLLFSFPRPDRAGREPVRRDADVVVVGAGVVGLATAAALARRGGACS